MSKVKINPNYPENPGLIEGKYYLYNTREFDFMDDPNTFPTKEQLRSNSTVPGVNYSDIDSKYRAARDAYKKENHDHSFNLLSNFRFSGDAFPKIFKNVTLDLTASTYNTWNNPAPAHILTNFVFPSMIDGNTNYPSITINGSENNPWTNPTTPVKSVLILKKPFNWSTEYLINGCNTTTGGDIGLASFNLPEGQGFSNPFAEYSWASDLSWVFDEFGMLYNYEDMQTFRRAIRDKVIRLNSDISDIKSRFSQADIDNGTAASLSYNNQTGSQGLTQEEFINAYYNLEAYSVLKTWFLSDPFPKFDGANCTLNGVESPEMKTAFANSYILQSLESQGLITPEERQEIIANPITPLEFFGDVNLEFLPAVKYFSELKGVTGQLGNLICVEETMTKYGFDGENWTEKQHNIYEEGCMTWARATNDANVKSFYELELATRPFVWAAHHIPAFTITANNEIRTPSDRTIFDFTSFHTV